MNKDTAMQSEADAARLQGDDASSAKQPARSRKSAEAGETAAGASQTRTNARGQRGRSKKGEGGDRMAAIQALLSAERYFVVVASGEEVEILSSWG